MNSRYATDKQKYKASAIVLAFFFGYLLILVRFYIIAVHNSTFYKNLAHEQYHTELEIMPPRAPIYGIDNTLIAHNKEITSAFILPRSLKDKAQSFAFLKQHYPAVLERIQKHPERKFLWVSRNITPQLRTMIEERNLQDIHFINEVMRFYPFPQLSPIIGITDIDNQGIAGIEQKFNDRLAGSASHFLIEKDARKKKFYFTKEVLSQGTSGNPLHLTLDAKLQSIATEEIKKTVEQYEAKLGASIIVNPVTGEILAMAQYPFYNPNAPTVEHLNDLKSAPLSDCYEFGSVMKIFTALTALEEKAVTLDEMFDCAGTHTYFGKFKVTNWKPLGVLNFSDAFRSSSNVALAKVAQRVGPKLYSNFNKLGFGSPTGVEILGERSGFISPPEKWSKSTVLVLSFGYEMNATLLQLAQAFSVISNNGKSCNLHITKREVQEGKQLYSQEVIDQTKSLLENSGALQTINGYRVMGKTGTARLVENGKYTNKRHIYTFGGLVEKDNYKRVIITFIKEPKRTHLWASEVSAPLFKRIAERTIIHDMFDKKLS
jgi:cell division protein FtsI (penicillin-binding protein 3)